MPVQFLAKAAMQIPWTRIAQVVIPKGIDYALDKLRKRKPSAPTRATAAAPASPPEDISVVLTARVQALEDALVAALEALRANVEELGKQHSQLVSATQIVSLRTKIALALSVASLLTAIGIIIWIFLR